MLVKFCDFLFSTVLETRRETTAAAMSWPVAFILAQKKMWQCDCADKVEQREREREQVRGRWREHLTCRLRFWLLF